MKNKYFNLLKKLAEEEKLNIFFIVAPPRSTSTLIEYILGLSIDIDLICHEPFIGARKEDFDPEVGYKNIYEKIGGDRFLNSTENKTLLIKEMSQFLDSKVHNKLFSLTKNKIIILIRNPLLTVESRIRRILKSLNLRPGLSLQQYLLDFFAKEDGFKNFNDGLKTLNFGLVLKNVILKAAELDLKSNDIYISPRIEIHKFLLDNYAVRFNYLNWNDIVEQKAYHEYDYNFFEEILKLNSHRNFFEEREFLNLLNLIEYFNTSSKKYIIYDATDIRIEPELYVKNICSNIGISFSKDMINWSRKVTIDTNQNKKHEKIWYQELYQSSEIKKPVEIPRDISVLPSFMQKYILNVNLPIYSILSLKKEIVVSAKKLNSTMFRINISNRNKRSLIQLGVVDENIKLGKVMISMEDIDPIYSVTNDLNLINNKDYVNKKNKYKIELTQIKVTLKNAKSKIINSSDFFLENEYIDLVDKNNIVIGITTVKVAHEKRQFHRVAGVLLFDDFGNIILQSGTKYNLIELSVGGHVKRGEDYEEAAHREMFEEIGVITKLDHLFTFLPANHKMGHFWSIFKGKIPNDWEFKETEEVKNIIKINFQVFLKKLKTEPNIFTPGTLNVMSEYVRFQSKNKIVDGK